jgi:hypothetical protein
MERMAAPGNEKATGKPEERAIIIAKRRIARKTNSM